MPLETLNDLVFHVRETSAGRQDLLRMARPGRAESLSTTDFLRSVHSLALALEARGLEKGERVAILAENRPEWHVVDLACHLLGAITVPILPASSPARVAFLLRNSGSRWVFYSDEEKRDLLLGVRAGLTAAPIEIAFDSGAAMPEGSVGVAPGTLTLLLGEGAPRLGEVPIERFRGRVGPADLASIPYTSGTTGDPKGVMLSHGNFVSNLLACAAVFDIGPDDGAVSFLPLAHIFQRTIDYLCLFRGVRISYVPSLDRVMAALRTETPTVMAAAPAVYERIHRRVAGQVEKRSAPYRRLFSWAVGVGKHHATASREGLIGPFLALQRAMASRLVFRRVQALLGGRLRFAVSGGAPLAGEVETFFEAVGVPVFQGYGLTEASPVLTANHPRSQRPGSVGKPLSEVEMRIAEDGEILVRGPGVMQGYWQNETATAASRDSSGWFRTGDLGHMDKSGYVFITDRKQDVLTLASGEKVAPRPIETLLTSSSPLIQQAVVVGEGRPHLAALLVPDSREARKLLGEEGPEAGSLAHRPELREAIGQAVAAASSRLVEEHGIRGFHILDTPLTVEAGELTTTFDLRRKEIGRRYAAEIEALYAPATGSEADAPPSR
ncbi:MAG: long-chain fatty acid--CoA ligase [Holophagales bacterium]|nr:long-chain fatty acid--CoA ligase [Holophagales bacterium]